MLVNEQNESERMVTNTTIVNKVMKHQEPIECFEPGVALAFKLQQKVFLQYFNENFEGEQSS